MAEIAGLAAPLIDQPSTAELTKAQLRWRRPPRWLWPVSIVLQVLSAALLTGYTYFFVDDFIFLQEARNQAFGSAYLREPLYEHFSPITRFFNKVLVDVAPGSFALAHGVQLALYAIALIAFAALMWTILGNRWAGFVLTVAFGQSLFLMRLLNWWTATANILPSTIFLLVSITAYLRWRPRRSWVWLGVSWLAFAASLLDYETALLFPAYLVLVALLVLEDKLAPRAWLAVLWRERWAWFGYGALEIAALYNFFKHYYFTSPHPSLGQLAHYLKFALVDAFVPALVGIKNPQLGLSNHAVVVAAAWLVVVGAVALALYLRPRAWRCLVAFSIIFVITMVPVGLNRIRQFGVGIGHELYYEQSVQCMLLVLAALALSFPRQRSVPHRLARAWSAGRAAPGTMAAAAVLAVAAYSALYISSVRAMANASPEPHRARAYVNAFRASVRRVEAETGRAPNLIDSDVPPDVIPPIFAPFDHYSQFFPMIQRGLRFDQASSPTYAVDLSGRLRPVRFAPSATGILGRATASAFDGSGDVSAARTTNGRGSKARSACAPVQRHTSRVHIPLASPQVLTTQVSGLPNALLVGARLPVGASVRVVLTGGRGPLADAGFPQGWGAGAARRFVPLTLATQVTEVDLDLPAGACVTELALGTFR